LSGKCISSHTEYTAEYFCLLRLANKLLLAAVGFVCASWLALSQSKQLVSLSEQVLGVCSNLEQLLLAPTCTTRPFATLSADSGVFYAEQVDFEPPGNQDGLYRVDDNKKTMPPSG
jgi:hypothetical protein